MHLTKLKRRYLVCIVLRPPFLFIAIPWYTLAHRYFYNLNLMVLYLKNSYMF